MGERTAATAGAVGYVRAPTDEPAGAALGHEAQEAAVRAECERRGLPLLAVLADAGAAAGSPERPALAEALARLDLGDGRVLVVAALDHLADSLRDAAGFLGRAERSGWGLVALDVALDTTTPPGAAAARVLVACAEAERRRAGRRTRDALAAKKAQGVKLGRPVAMDPATVARIVAARAAGASYSAIARSLDAEGVPTAQGGARWYPATVRNVVLAHEKRAA